MMTTRHINAPSRPAIWLRSCMLVVAAVFLCTSALGNDEQVSWQSLSQQQQRVLRGMESRWENFDVAKRQRLASGATRLGSMTPQEQKRARNRFRQWNNMPEERKERIRKRYRRFLQLTPEEKARVRENRRVYRALPQAERQSLRKKFRAMTPEERRKRATQSDISKERDGDR